MQPMIRSSQSPLRSGGGTKETRSGGKVQHRSADNSATMALSGKKPNLASTRMGRVAGQEAQRFSEDFDLHSRLAKRTRRRRRITALRWSDLEVGKLLGSGNFSQVYEVRLRDNPDPLPDEVDSVAASTVSGVSGRTIKDDKAFAGRSMWSENDHRLDIWDLISTDGMEDDEETDGSSDEEDEGLSEAIYALKHLHPEITSKQKDFTASAIDLVLEAKILACLDHPNIIRLYGVTGGCISNVFCGAEAGYFLLLDRLHGTLEDKIQEWSAMELGTSMNSMRGRRSLPGGPVRGIKNNMPRRSSAGATVAVPDTEQTFKEKCKLVDDRIRTYVLDVTRGMEYLHQHKIIFRDLKPSNVGLTKSGKIKIFDFGLAREILDSEQRLTGNTGSLRYMAPEVNRREHYNVSADVYSFGIMLWEMCALAKPFKGMTKEEHADMVINRGFRPKISTVPGSNDLRKMIQGCWSTQAKNRPTFAEVRRFLIRELAFKKKLEKMELDGKKLQEETELADRAKQQEEAEAQQQQQQQQQQTPPPQQQYKKQQQQQSGRLRMRLRRQPRAGISFSYTKIKN